MKSFGEWVKVFIFSLKFLMPLFPAPQGSSIMSPEQPSTQSAEMPRQDTLGFFSDTSPAFRLKVLQATVVMDVWWNCRLARPATPSPSLTCQVGLQFPGPTEGSLALRRGRDVTVIFKTRPPQGPYCRKAPGRCGEHSRKCLDSGTR